ncbi:MAG: hypothetical protein IID33_16405, partial [Planctomycetes bacterium]|nr:hypothetical protein [Planctomycetota bacterium]
MRRSSSRRLPLALFVMLAPAASADAQNRDGDAIAIVNGRTITRQQVVDLLIESHGLGAMQQMIMLELARSETLLLVLDVTQADIQAEY